MEVGIGEAGSIPEGTKAGATEKPEASDEVGGRYRRRTTVICPYCCAACVIIEETEYRMWFDCWNCHGDFQY